MAMRKESIVHKLEKRRQNSKGLERQPQRWLGRALGDVLNRDS